MRTGRSAVSVQLAALLAALLAECCHGGTFKCAWSSIPDCIAAGHRCHQNEYFVWAGFHVWCDPCGELPHGATEWSKNTEKTKCYVEACNKGRYAIGDECRFCPITNIGYETAVVGPYGAILTEVEWLGEASLDRGISCGGKCIQGTYWDKSDKKCKSCPADDQCPGHSNHYLPDCGSTKFYNGYGDCVLCPKPSPGYYRKGCIGYNGGYETQCTTAGSKEYYEKTCSDYEDAVVKSCPTAAGGHCSGNQYLKCGYGVKKCVEKKSNCPLGKHISLSNSDLSDNTCVACKTCGVNQYRHDCGPGQSAGECKQCSCPEGKYGTKDCNPDGKSLVLASDLGCKPCKDKPNVGYDQYLINCGIEHENNDEKQLGEWVPCTVCQEEEYLVSQCGAIRDSTKDRVCGSCHDTQLSCDPGKYIHCGGSTNQPPFCDLCRSDCSPGQYIANCNNTHYVPGSEGGGVCTDCAQENVRFCYAGYKVQNDCTGYGLADSSYCIHCNEAPANAHYNGPQSPLPTGGPATNCGWQCDEGYYKNGTINEATNETTYECLPCSTAACPAGQYRTHCYAGSEHDAICIACSGVTQCAQGEYIARCSGSTGADVPATCAACTTTPCTAGQQRAVCDGRSYENAACQVCGSIPANAVSVSGCDWVCKAGFYRQNNACHECTYNIFKSTCPYLRRRRSCIQGRETTDPPCECIEGFEDVKVFGWNHYCTPCTEYQFNDELGGTCRDCPVGYQGNGFNGMASKSCEPCPVNFFRNSSMQRCEFCASGTDGHTGMSTCRACPTGHIASVAATWSGYVWDYNTEEWASYTGSNNIPCDYQDKLFCIDDTPQASYGLANMYWIEANHPTPLPSIPQDGNLMLDKVPQYPQTCDQCQAGSIFLQ